MTDPDVHRCTRCERPMRHDTALVCSPCASLLKRALEGVARIAGDITLTVAKMDRVARGGGQADDLGWWRRIDDYDPTRRPATNLAFRTTMDRSALPAVPMPPRLDAAERHDAAVGELGTWTRHIVAERGGFDYNGSFIRVESIVPADAIPHRHPLRAIAWMLSENLEWLRHRPEADEAWPALLAACSELERVVDTRIAGELVGMCACGTARYSTDRTCPRCRSEEMAYDRTDLNRGREEFVVTASEAARYVADSGLVRDTTKLRKLIWAWADRGHLEAVDDVPRYRLGDVLDRVMASPALLRVA